MGKSTTARIFADAGVPVWDADAAVRVLYAKGGAAAQIIAQTYPEAMQDEAVSRPKLRALIALNPKVLDHIQTLVHPLVAQSRAAFLASTTAPVVVLDIPLLYEGRLDTECDAVVVVTAPAHIQKERILARGEMNERDIETILARQMPDAEKRRKARWVIETLTLDAVRQAVTEILSEIQGERPDA